METTIPAQERRADLQVLRAESRAILRALKRCPNAISEIAQQFGVHPDRVRWIRDVHDLPRGRVSAHVDRKEDVKALLEQNGGIVKPVVRATGVPQTTIRQWKAKWMAEGWTPASASEGAGPASTE